MRKIDLSIIIVSYNTRDLLGRCLESIFTSLERADLGVEVIVVDNNSEDKSAELVKTKYSDTILIENNENVGFGKANNQAAKVAKGSTLLFLNSDVVVKDAAILKLFNYFKAQPAKTIVSGKLFNLDGSPQSSCGPKYSLTNIFIALFLKGDYLNITRYSPSQIKEVDWVMGACMMVGKTEFWEIGGFDEGIFMYMEEIDWQYRAKKTGFRIIFYPDAHFSHVGAGSSSGRSTPILNVFRGLKYYYKKHFPGFKNIILRVILVSKAVSAIFLFSILGRKSDRKLYNEALQIALS